MTITEINFALADIQDTLAIYRDAPMTAYTAKLWDEFDTLMALKIKIGG